MVELGPSVLTQGATLASSPSTTHGK
jgi:hypothetical protein